MIRTVQSQLIFIGKFFRFPRQIGAILPSSPALARRIVHLAGASNSNTIVEFGPGTGVFTKEIIAKMPETARLITVEADANLALLLRKKYRRAHVAAGYAQHIQRIMKAHKLSEADCIVSGLPWATFNPQLQDDILTSAYAVLKPGGIFTTFGYLHALSLPSAKRFYAKLHQTFSTVRVSRVVWKNVPPAIIYQCTKTKTSSCSGLN